MTYLIIQTHYLTILLIMKNQDLLQDPEETAESGKEFNISKKFDFIFKICLETKEQN